MNEVVISKDIINSYYEALRDCIEYKPERMKLFQLKYPDEYKLISSIHRKRSKINSAIKALVVLNRDIYWGTLTFNSKKNINTVRTKRREAFISLNKLFDYFLLVEELGEEKGRYHIHFLGSLKYGFSTSDFFSSKIWKSRRQIEKVDTKKNISSYLVKYLSKDLPRVRTNKLMCKLIKSYKEGLKLENLHFNSIGVSHQVQKVNTITIFDLDFDES